MRAEYAFQVVVLLFLASLLAMPFLPQGHTARTRGDAID
jgi:hypothetical protein